MSGLFFRSLLVVLGLLWGAGAAAIVSLGGLTAAEKQLIFDAKASKITNTIISAPEKELLEKQANTWKWLKMAEAAQDMGLNADGKFVDNLLETEYLKYVSTKTANGKTPRERLDWKNVRDYWLIDSPMARGNAFNKKAVTERWYDYNEVTLANGKRVDSYTPPTGSKLGEIVSRKATNLEEIELSTFESYLKEMKAKYSAGEPINAPKYGDKLKGKVLEGKQILEIPSSNQGFSQIQEYIDLAKNKYNIEIRFKPE
jgi:hypothetical protein